VLSRIDLRGSPAATLSRDKLADVLPRAELDVEAAGQAVRPICDDVRNRGAAAVREYTARFDGVHLPTTRVPAHALAEALQALAPDVRAALEETIRRVRLVHEAQRPPDTTTTVAPGSFVTERYVPVDRAGVYVPGGLVAYPSSVIMNVVPAQVAGVAEIAVASPPRPRKDGLDGAQRKVTGRDGTPGEDGLDGAQREVTGRHGTPGQDRLPDQAVLAACALLGVEEVHAVGGAQAIAMFGYGTADCAAADTVTGPGNVYVAAAKRLLLGTIGTDAEAGPTEVAIIADHTADPEFVAADLIAQAEHDPLAACLLITTDATLADRTDEALDRQVSAARHRDRVQAALDGQSACVLVDDLDAALAVADAWAPEHLEIQAEGAAGLARRVRNAGAVFVGPYAPVSLGDYLAGSNHVLPTGGTARHSGGLSVLSFLRGIHLVECDDAALARVAPHIDALGGAEDLAAHVAAVRVRVPVPARETTPSSPGSGTGAP
jgi:histidinol dehydrogenase